MSEAVRSLVTKIKAPPSPTRKLVLGLGERDAERALLLADADFARPHGRVARAFAAAVGAGAPD